MCLIYTLQLTINLFWYVTPCGPVKVTEDVEETAASLVNIEGNILPGYTTSHIVTDWYPYVPLQ